jgi:hypothetical protein
VKWTWKLELLILTLLGAAPRAATAQSASPAATFLRPLPNTGAAFPDSGGHGLLAFLIFMAVTTAVFAVIAKLVDLREKRTEQKVMLENEVTDALLESRPFAASSVIPTVHIPLWSGSPATIEVSGELPSRQLEQSALRLAAQAASRIRSDFSIDNRLAVAPCSDRQAA